MLKERVEGGVDRSAERGSAMLMAIFAMVLLTAMGAALLFNSSTEVKMAQAGIRAKQAFYFAEAGLEHGRTALHNVNGGNDFSDDLAGVAGLNNRIDFDPQTLVPVFGPNGNLTGFTGHGDDSLFTPITPLADGWYAAFLTNDPEEEEWKIVDGDKKVMIAGIGVGPGGSFEIVQAIFLREEIFPSYPPATITLLGPLPEFEGAQSSPKVYDGEDCGVSGATTVPVVGTIGSAAEAHAENGITSNPTFSSGTYSDEGTFVDLTVPGPLVASTIDPLWTDCLALKEMVETVRLVAHWTCNGGGCPLPAMSPNTVMFADGDYAVPGGISGQGMLLVTGELDLHGGADWQGLIYVIGEGRFVRSGSGNGVISGASLVADIAGPDNVYGTDDDCTGGDGGFDSVLYSENGGGSSDTVFCSNDFALTNPARPYDILAFRQH